MNEVPRTSELGSTPRPGVVRRKYCWVSARTAKRGQVSNFAVFLRNSLPVPGLPLADHTLPDPLHGLYEQLVRGKHSVVEYEPDFELRDTEQVPLLETGGVEAFFRREVLPHDARCLDRPRLHQDWRRDLVHSLLLPAQAAPHAREIRADILAVQKEAGGLLDELLQGSAK
jgi:hypothetical protein